VFEQVMYGQDVRTTEASRNPEEVWNMNYVTMQPPYDRAKFQVSLESVVAPGQPDRVEVRREGAAFCNFGWRPDQ
jgi:hypothetical protein